MNINKNRINRTFNNDQRSSNSGHSYSSEYTVNSAKEIIFLVSFYDTVALDNSNYFDKNYDMVMSENKPFICCSTVSFNKNRVQQADIYVGEGETKPWIGYVINQKLALIIAHSLKDAWTDKDTFNFKKAHAKVEQENINLVLDKNIKLDKEVEKKLDNGESFTKKEFQELRKKIAPNEYYSVSRMYNGEEHIVYVSYDTLCQKCKDALKDIRENQKQANSSDYTEETVSTMLGKTLKTSQMMIELDRAKQNFGKNGKKFKSNPKFKEGVENIIKFLMKKQLDAIYVIDSQEINVWSTSQFLQQLADKDIQAKYQIDEDGCIVPRQQQNMQNNIMNTNIINVLGVNKNYNNEATKDKQGYGSTVCSSQYWNNGGNNDLKTSRLGLDKNNRSKNNKKKPSDQRNNSANVRKRVTGKQFEDRPEVAPTNACFFDYPNGVNDPNHRRNDRHAGRQSGINNQFSPRPYTVRRDANNTRPSSTEKCCCGKCCKCCKCNAFCNIF